MLEKSKALFPVEVTLILLSPVFARTQLYSPFNEKALLSHLRHFSSIFEMWVS